MAAHEEGTEQGRDGADAPISRVRLHGRTVGRLVVVEMNAGPLLELSDEFTALVGDVMERDSVGVLSVTDGAGELTGRAYVISHDRLAALQAAGSFARQQLAHQPQGTGQAS